MELIKTGMAGTVESGDILVEIEQNGASGVEIQLDSTVMGLYGRQIRKGIEETVAECGVDGIKVIASDSGSDFWRRGWKIFRSTRFWSCCSITASHAGIQMPSPMT